MNDHDPLCHCKHLRIGDGCDCAVIIEARADERERIARAIEAESGLMFAKTLYIAREVAARIARGEKT